MDEKSRLSSVGYVSIAGTRQRKIGSFTLDPEILLPVDLPPGPSKLKSDELSWEAIVAGTLKVLAWDQSNPHTDYYRRFVLAVKPEIREEFTHLGILKARDGDAELAIEVFRALEGLFPDDPATLQNLALAYEERARQHEKRENEPAAEEYQGLAFEAYKRALAADPSEPTIHYNLAFFYLHQRSFEKAKEHLQFFVNTGSDEKRLSEARRIIKEIDTQGLIDGLFQKAFDSIRMGREKEGIEHIEQFLASRPNFQNAWFLLGWAHRRLGQYARGKEAFLKALGVGAPHADLLNELAICLMEMGELAESRKRLLEALNLEPENTKVISNLGIVALKSGNQEEARGFFRTVLEYDPEDRIAARYLESLPEKKQKKA
jgi:Flp pilus assembly protein TadD